LLEAAGVEGFEPLPIVMAWATASGPVTDAVFEEVTGHLTAELTRLRPDGLLLALHDAIVTESHSDVDGEVLALAAAVGLGTHNPAEIEVRGLALKEARHSFGWEPETREK
jgi:microcystin degradation protein MlrC